MNAQRRKEIDRVLAQIAEARALLKTARDDLDTLRDEEQEYYDAVPESFQSGEKGDRALSAIDALQSAYDTIDNLDFDELESQLETAKE